MAFKLGKKQVLYKGEFLTLHGTEFYDKSGKLQQWEYAEKKDVVCIFPITDDGKVILIKSYRVPIESYVIETPAGLIDKEGESHEQAARRELLEETGYAADEWHALPGWPYRSGSSKNFIYGFIAKDLRKIEDFVGDETEDITIMEIPLEELAALWLNPAPDTFFQPEILAMHEAAVKMGLTGDSDSAGAK